MPEVAASADAAKLTIEVVTSPVDDVQWSVRWHGPPGKRRYALDPDLCGVLLLPPPALYASTAWRRGTGGKMFCSAGRQPPTLVSTVPARSARHTLWYAGQWRSSSRDGVGTIRAHGGCGAGRSLKTSLAATAATAAKFGATGGATSASPWSACRCWMEQRRRRQPSRIGSRQRVLGCSIQSENAAWPRSRQQPHAYTCRCLTQQRSSCGCQRMASHGARDSHLGAGLARYRSGPLSPRRGPSRGVRCRRGESPQACTWPRAS